MATGVRFATVITLVIAPLAMACTEPTERVDAVARRAESPLPDPRGYTAMVYDSQSREFVALGGVTGGAPTGPPEVWVADQHGRDWRRVGPMPTGHVVAAAYHAALDRIVVWSSTRPRPDGGGNLEPFLPADTVSETWTYDVDHDHWERIATAVSPPPGLFGTRMSYDAESRMVIMFGGFDVTTFTFHDETWAFDLDHRAWTAMSPAIHPTGRNFHGQAYHAAADRVLVIAGLDVTFEPTNHVWSYDYNTNTWIRLASPGAPVRDYVSVAYVDDTERVVLHGGLLYGPDFEELSQSDTWEYDLGHDRWRLIDTGGGPGEPGPRAFHAMASRTGSDQVLMFGGGVDHSTAFTNEVWRYEADDHAWERVR